MEKKQKTVSELSAFVQNADMASILLILEEMEDEERAVVLLKEFNEKSKRFGEMAKKRGDYTQAEYEAAFQELRDVVLTILKEGHSPLLATF